MSGRSSAGRSRASRVRGRHNSTCRGNYGNHGNNVSHVDMDEHMDQYDGLNNLNETNTREIGSPSSQAHPCSNAPSSQAQLGSNAPRSSPANPTLWISITPDRARFTKANGQADNSEISRSITGILKNYYCGAWPTWTSVPIVDKNRMFESFQKTYSWDPAIDQFVHHIFNAAIARRLSDRLSMDRDLAYAKAEAAGNPVIDDDLSPILPYNPTWMKQEHWRELVTEHWNKEGWIKISKANKTNRSKFVAGHHCTGSAGFVAFRERFEEKMGGPQSSLAFLIASHTKKGMIAEGEGSSSSNALIDDRAREAAERLSDSMIERYGPDVSTHPKHDQELWERATGARRKGRAYCSGSSSDPSFVLTGTPSADSGSSYARPTFEEVEKVKETMEKMREEHEKTKSETEEREERLRKEVEDSKAATEEVRREMNEMNEKWAEILKRLPNPHA